MEKLNKHANGQWTLEKADKIGNVSNQLGISDGKGKIKFSPGFGQKEFRKYVEQRADHMCETGFLAGTPDTWNWHYDPEFEMDKLISIKGNREGWVSWYRGEMTEWEHDHGDEKKGHFEKWAKNPEVKPIIVVEGTDGKWHVIDGHHRTAMGFIKNMKHVPTIVGKRKD